MVTSALDLYDKLLSATDDKARARILAEAFEALEERFPNLAETATRRDLSETELRLVKEIEQVRGEIKETELKLAKEIEQVRAELKVDIEQVRSELTKEIERVRAELKVDIERVRVELAERHASWLRWSFLFWVSQFAGILLILWRIWPRG